MIELRALFYADGRAFMNEAKRVVRSAGRMTLWVVYALGFVVFTATRVSVRERPAGDWASADRTRADYFVVALIGMLVVAVASGRGPIGIFRTRAEARFIIASPVRAPLAIAYLQTRESLAIAGRLLLSFAYTLVVFGPRSSTPATVLYDVTFIFAVVVAAHAIVVPRRLLPRTGAIVCIATSVPLGLFAITPLLRSIVASLPAALTPPVLRHALEELPRWHPGQVLLEPSALWLLATVALAAAAVATLAIAGRDAYPELYALSVARIDRLERWRRRRTTSTSSKSPPAARAALQPTAHTSDFIPAGVLVFVWKSVVEYRRTTRLAGMVGVGVVCCGGGFVAGRLLQREYFFSTLAGIAINVLLFTSITATDTIAADIRRPLFWLAADGLFERLAALLLARVWRPIVTLELIGASFALAGGAPFQSLFVMIALPMVVVLLAAIAFATFTLFPRAADVRGPGAILRLGSSVVLLLPPIVAFFIVSSVAGSPLAALVAATVVALVQAGALIGFSAWRLDGRIDTT